MAMPFKRQHNKQFRKVFSIWRLLEVRGGIKGLPLTKMEYTVSFRTIPLNSVFGTNKQTSFVLSFQLDLSLKVI